MDERLDPQGSMRHPHRATTRRRNTRQADRKNRLDKTAFIDGTSEARSHQNSVGFSWWDSASLVPPYLVWLRCRMNVAGIVLCGGGSRRMGRPKFLLPFGPELMLQRVVRLVGQSVGPVAVVAADGQALPELPAHVIIARDGRPDRGPLEAMAAGLRSVAGLAEVAFVAACDVPLLRPLLIRRVVELLGEHDATVPHVAGRDHPLLGAYRLSVLRQVEDLLAADELRPRNCWTASAHDELPPRSWPT